LYGELNAAQQPNKNLSRRQSKQHLSSNINNRNQHSTPSAVKYPRNRQKLNNKPSLNESDLWGITGSSKKNQKVSLNHLLNFSFPERERPGNASFRRSSYLPYFDKEKYVNAK
jgi:hypothetical protein